MLSYFFWLILNNLQCRPNVWKCIGRYLLIITAEQGILLRYASSITWLATLYSSLTLRISEFVLIYVKVLCGLHVKNLLACCFGPVFVTVGYVMSRRADVCKQFWDWLMDSEIVMVCTYHLYMYASGHLSCAGDFPGSEGIVEQG